MFKLTKAALAIGLPIVVSLGSCAQTDNTSSSLAPNILLIVADDLGYSDIAPFGGEISTPNLDRLASEGTRFTNFHTAIKCNPTRAMLLTGIDNNSSATGTRRDWQLAKNAATIPEVLKASGYQSYITGKWDAGSDEGEIPADRGFDKSYVMLPGAGTHFKRPAPVKDAAHRENGQAVELPEDFYSSKTYTDKLLSHLIAHNGEESPFFAFLSYTAPHYPLQAPPASIAKYKGRYDGGFAAIRNERLKRISELDLLPSPLTAWDNRNVTDWNTMSETDRAFAARKMEIYAAMVEDMDREIGRVLAYLDSKNLTQNTLVIFMSDNGADGTARGAGANETDNNSLENIGSSSSFVTVGADWAQVSSTPFQLYKTFTTEGGVRTPFIARLPGIIPAGEINHNWFQVMDLLPTFMAISNTPHPSSTDDSIQTVQGRNIMPVLTNSGPAYESNDTVYHTYTEGRLGGAYVQRGDWKLVWWKENRIMQNAKLFNIHTDPAELHDVRADHPHIAKELWQAWLDYAQENSIELTENGPADSQSF